MPGWWLSGWTHDECQVAQLDAAAFGCDAVGRTGAGVVVLGHRSASCLGRRASGGTHRVIVAEETWLTLSTGI
ncbi:hypothetical protein A8M60_02190 [Nocardia farcinica]|nr:hypothetical protein A8M60_02190 [Nocardia farcinica]